MSELEHVNITVPDPKVTAAMMIDLFGWHVRWEGASMEGTGYTVHVGTERSYVALYTGPGEQVVPKGDASYVTRGGLNHLGVVVDDLEAVEGPAWLHLTPRIGQRRHHEGGRAFALTEHSTHGHALSVALLHEVLLGADVFGEPESPEEADGDAGAGGAVGLAAAEGVEEAVAAVLLSPDRDQAAGAVDHPAGVELGAVEAIGDTPLDRYDAPKALAVPKAALAPVAAKASAPPAPPRLAPVLECRAR